MDAVVTQDVSLNKGLLSTTNNSEPHPLSLNGNLCPALSVNCEPLGGGTDHCLNLTNLMCLFNPTSRSGRTSTGEELEELEKLEARHHELT